MRSAIDHVQITVAETVGLEGRGAYYDGAGALRDMVQNHMLQLLALVAMEPPAQLRRDRGARREGQGAALAAPAERRRRRQPRRHRPIWQRGDRRASRSPAMPRSLARSSRTETFVAIKAHVDNWRWKGVPFYLRTGKRLPERRTEIVIQFKPRAAFDLRQHGAKTTANRLVIAIQPEENIRLALMAKTPGLDRDGIRLREVPLDISLPDAFAGTRRRIAYERLLLDLIEGDQTLFVRRDEVEAQWQWIDGIRAAWEAAGVEPQILYRGKLGAAAAIALTERDGVSWHD